MSASRTRVRGFLRSALLPYNFGPFLKSIAMSADPPAYVMLDTNSLMHFQRPDQIDWVSILKSKEVKLVVTPT